jgi:flagellar biosynthesis GTPase FlhF
MAPSKSNLVDFRPVDAKEEGDEEADSGDEEDRRAAEERRLANEKQAAEEKRLNELEQQRLREAEAAEVRAARAREEEERRVREAESRKDDLEERREETKSSELTMNASQFKALWSTMDPAGSFQCRLKMMPTLSTFVDHMKRQVMYR